MSSVIYFDIDFTLFNTNKMRYSYILPAFQELLETDADSIEKAGNEYRASLEKSTDFTPQAYTAFLADYFKKDAASLFAVFSQSATFENSLYAETKTELDFWKSNGFRLGIYSEGLQDFQEAKLRLSGILPYFDAQLILIARRKLLPEIVEKLESDAYVVDDNVEVIDGLQGTRVFSVWLNRTDTTLHIKSPTIFSLLGLREVIAPSVKK
jgi:FMN phosphatase YigB (HAD superfamily)